MSENKKSEDYTKGETDGFWKGVVVSIGALATAFVAIVAGKPR